MSYKGRPKMGERVSEDDLYEALCVLTQLVQSTQLQIEALTQSMQSVQRQIDDLPTKADVERAEQSTRTDFERLERSVRLQIDGLPTRTDFERLEHSVKKDVRDVREVLGDMESATRAMRRRISALEEGVDASRPVNRVTVFERPIRAIPRTIRGLGL